MNKVVDWSDGTQVLRDMTPQEVADATEKLGDVILQSVDAMNAAADAMIDAFSPVRLQRISAKKMELLRAYKLTPVSPPAFLTAEATRRGITALQCVDAMIAEITSMDQYLVNLDEIRNEAIYRLNQATTIADVRTVVSAAIVSLRTLTP